MKFGIRTPSLKKSFSARTTGKINRSIKKAINPIYGKKGVGMINNPSKSVYNKIYNKTTIGVDDIINHNTWDSENSKINNYSNKKENIKSNILRTISICIFISSIIFFISGFHSSFILQPVINLFILIIPIAIGIVCWIFSLL